MEAKFVEVLPPEEDVDEGDEGEDEGDNSEDIDFEPRAKKSKDSGEKKQKGKDESDVDVDFEFYDMKESDFHSVKTLLQSYIEIPGKDFLSSEFADLIAGQAAVGTTVKTEGCEEEPIGFITILSLQHHHNSPAIKQIREFVFHNCPKEHAAKLEALWNPKGPPLGLLVQARMVNLPFQLVAPLHNAVLEDLDWAVQHDESEELKKSFRCDNFLLIAKAYPATGKKRGREPQRFRYTEEEYYMKEATLSFRFPCPVKKDPPMEFVVMVVPKKRVNHAIAAASAAIFEVPIHVSGRLKS